MAFTAASLLLQAGVASAEETSLEATPAPARPMSAGVGVSTLLLILPNFVVGHFGYDLGSVASVNADLGAGPNMDDASVWMFRPGLQLRLFPVGDIQGGMFLAPDLRAWTFGTAALWQLGGRVGGRIPTASGFVWRF